MTDPSSIADATKWLTKHIHLNWLIDFELKTISGFVTLTVEGSSSDELVLDASELEIAGVTVEGQAVPFKYDPKGGRFGGALSVQLSKDNTEVKYSNTSRLLLI